MGHIDCVCFHRRFRRVLAARHAACRHSGIGNRGAAEPVFPRMETIWRIVPAVRAAVAAVAGMAASGGSGSAGSVLNRKAVYAMNWHMQLLYL